MIAYSAKAKNLIPFKLNLNRGFKRAGLRDPSLERTCFIAGEIK